MAAGLVSVNGTRLFADDRGDASAPPLLFIHGGPGQSCSDPLPPEPALTAAVLIADFEALREHLE